MNTKFKNMYDDLMLSLIKNEREINDKDIERIKEYIQKIPCQSYIDICGTGIGCLNCPHYHFKLVINKLIEKFENRSF